MQKQRIEIFEEIIELVKKFNGTNPQEDEKNLNSIMLIGSVQIEGKEVLNNLGEIVEKPVKEITAVIGKEEDVMNTVIKALIIDNRLYEVFKQGTAIVMNEHFNQHINNLKN